MNELCAWLCLAVAAVTGVSGLVGSLLWWVDRPLRWAWLLLRLGQAIAAALAVLAGVRYLAGPAPRDDLFYLYALLPTVVAFVAEQLRLTSAEAVLEQRDLDGSAAVRALPEHEQTALVAVILRRELGIVAVAALVSAFLALRGWGTV